MGVSGHFSIFYLREESVRLHAFGELLDGALKEVDDVVDRLPVLGLGGGAVVCVQLLHVGDGEGGVELHGPGEVGRGLRYLVGQQVDLDKSLKLVREQLFIEHANLFCF